MSDLPQGLRLIQLRTPTFELLPELQSLVANRIFYFEKNLNILKIGTNYLPFHRGL